jgi:hypothetical protein
METVTVELPSALLKAANLEERNLSQQAARLLALELYREYKVSLGRAAELCQTVPRIWKRNACPPTVPKRDRRSRFIPSGYSGEAWLLRPPQ